MFICCLFTDSAGEGVGVGSACPPWTVLEHSKWLAPGEGVRGVAMVGQEVATLYDVLLRNTLRLDNHSNVKR